MKKEKSKKVIVAMSGGVDSSVATALLKRGGFALRQAQGNPEQSRGIDVIGVFMKFWSEPLRGSPLINADSNANFSLYENRCCSSEAEARARKVAAKLKIPFYVLSFEKEFKKKVVDYFLKEYKAGRTPNPCVVCNKEIKFGFLLKKARELGADFIATGHYAQVQRKNGFHLLRGKDRTKDQSYFLWQLSQEQLKHILFPVGNYIKSQVRNLAKKFGLPVLDVPESQEICFVQTSINDFLSKYLKPKPGKIMDRKGNLIGRHQGLHFYTIGQRKGLGISGGPWYVSDKDLKRNILVLTKNEKDLEKKELIAENVNWLSGKAPKLPLKVKAKIRYRHQPAIAILDYDKKSKVYRLKFMVAQRAITPGQSVVFYQREELLGGGIIKKSC